MIKVYYRLEMKQTSPLHLSNGDSELSDNDLMKDSRGFPFIPGTGLTGALRDLVSEEEGRKLFGWITDGEQQSSRVIVSDGILPRGISKEKIHFTYRDGVGLDLFRGTVIEEAKYDFEVVETDIPFTAILEWTGEKDDESLIILQKIVQRIMAEGLTLGGKVTRGYGAMRVSAGCQTFSFPDDLQKWLDFSPHDAAALWQPVEQVIIQNSQIRVIHLSLRLAGPFLTRVYSSEPGKADFVSLRDKNGHAVIPGNAWAGAFRHRMHEIAGELGLPPEIGKEIDSLFGKIEGANRRSMITFSQTEIQGGTADELTRNALDRFTSAPAMSALYTTGYWRGGTGELEIGMKKEACGGIFEQLLLAAIRDLHFGLMTIGGNAATGMGEIRITRMLVDGAERNDFIMEEC